MTLLPLGATELPGQERSLYSKRIVLCSNLLFKLFLANQDVNGSTSTDFHNNELLLPQQSFIYKGLRSA